MNSKSHKPLRRAVFLTTPALWERGHGKNHPLKPERLQRTFELLEAYGAFAAPNVRVVAPQPATEDELALFHSRNYIEVVRILSEGGAWTETREYINPMRYGFGSGDNPIFPEMYETESLKAGSSLMGARLLVNGDCDVAFSYAGGLHHAMASYASGFCVFNDPAIAIQWMVDQGLRVAYVDVDVHHGDGVEAAFYDTDRVLTISLHQDGRTLFPGTGFIHDIGSGDGEGYAVNVPLLPDTDDEIYLWAFREVVPPLLERFAPDVVVSQLGVDTHYKDPLAHMALTTAGQTTLFEAFDALAPRWLALGGGGYNLDVVPRSWTLAFGVMSGQTFPDALPESYRARYGGQWLRDHESPPLSDAAREYVAERTREVIAEVKRTHHIP
ncbi:MAG TPA: acetoin utilization protein AcuC [Anaerolineae bacterium]|nr:acetoin utilization protein AcuC [Anaerolineae bacterium]HQK13272.1 acetoin utilization protein AcuC [Anaerolineae bacterium]